MYRPDGSNDASYVRTDLLNHSEKRFQEHINARLPNRDVVITVTSHYRHIGWISLRAFIPTKAYPTEMTTYHRPLLSMIIGFLWPILAIGQGTQSSVSGTIRDAAGEPLTGLPLGTRVIRVKVTTQFGDVYEDSLSVDVAESTME